MTQAVRKFTGRTLFGIVDQGLSSASNFATAFLASVTLNAASFGTFTVSLSFAFIAIGVQRGLAGEPMLAHVSTAEMSLRQKLFRDAVSTSVLLGFIMMLTSVGVWMLNFALLKDLIWLAPWLPGILLQDAGRYAFLTIRRPDKALVLDAIWLLVQIVSMAIFYSLDLLDSTFIIAAWGLGATVSGASYVLVTGLKPWQGRPRAWLKETRYLSSWLVPTALLGQAQQQMALVLIGGILSASTLGAVRAVQLMIVQPVLVLVAALTALLIPWAATINVTFGAKLLKIKMWRLFAWFLLGGVLVLLTIPLRHNLLNLFLPKYKDATALVLPMALQAFCYWVFVPFTVALRGMRRARSQFSVQVATTTLTVAGVLVGALVGGAQGAAWGMAAGTGVLLVGTVFLVLRAFKVADEQPQGPELSKEVPSS